jgi:hypothetical protein
MSSGERECYAVFCVLNRCRDLEDLAPSFARSSRMHPISPRTRGVSVGAGPENWAGGVIRRHPSNRRKHSATDLTLACSGLTVALALLATHSYRFRFDNSERI